MIALGYALCLLLSLVALFAAASVATRLALKGGAEFALAMTVFWLSLILAPIHVLGALNLLWPGVLAPTSVAMSLLVVIVSAHGSGLRAHVSATAQALSATLSRARGLVVAVWQAGPLVTSALAAFIFAVGWTALLTYLLPSDSWDGVWYHDLTVGYVIQQHGYANIDLPAAPIQQGNGYPRNSEMLSLWFMIFADRSLIELPSVLAAVVLALAAYCLCKRYAAEPVTCLLWGISLALLPGARLEMRTTYVDLLFGALTLVAYYFASDPKLDAKRSILAACALGLALGSKGQALLAVPFLGVLALCSVGFNEGRRRLGRTALALGASLILILVLGGVTYLLNWLRHENPFWPISMKVGPFDFPGVLAYSHLDVNSFHNILDNLLGVPKPGQDYADTRISGYGTFGFFVAPFAALGALAACTRLLRASARSIVERTRPEGFGSLATLVAISAIATFSLWKSTAIWSARYNLAAVGVAVALVHWYSQRFARPNALSFGAASAAFVTNIAMWWWSDPGWGPKGIVEGPRDVARLLQLPSLTRAGISLLHDKDMVQARERELRPGDKVIWTDDSWFPALLWNERHSNVLMYRPRSHPAERFIDDAERVNARWLVVGGAWAEVARSRPERWREVAASHKNHSPVPIFQRLP
jgi:hypothetical protein